MTYQLRDDVYESTVPLEPTRAGYGRGLKAAGDADDRVVALCADLTESTQMHIFKEAHPDRFIEVGIAEQNLITLASGLARLGKIPFTSSYAAFSPGRSWEQIKTTVCLNKQPVKIIGSHAGLYTGPDGATHQMLEDIALTRVLPGMVVVVPGDSVEAEKATKAIARNDKPSYLRLAREKTPIFSTEDSPFELGVAYVLREGHDVSLIGTGTMTHTLLLVAHALEEFHISAEVIHAPTIKPLDEETILSSIRKTGRAITAEEAQVVGGLGGAVAELLSEKLPTPLKRLGVHERFGESGSPKDLFPAFGLDAVHITEVVRKFVDETPKYHQGF